jgi:hypothetical protein
MEKRAGCIEVRMSLICNAQGTILNKLNYNSPYTPTVIFSLIRKILNITREDKRLYTEYTP